MSRQARADIVRHDLRYREIVFRLIDAVSSNSMIYVLNKFLSVNSSTEQKVLLCDFLLHPAVRSYHVRAALGIPRIHRAAEIRQRSTELLGRLRHPSQLQSAFGECRPGLWSKLWKRHKLFQTWSSRFWSCSTYPQTPADDWIYTRKIAEVLGKNLWTIGPVIVQALVTARNQMPLSNTDDNFES